jgi:hypothetical protein
MVIFHSFLYVYQRVPQTIFNRQIASHLEMGHDFCVDENLIELDRWTQHPQQDALWV